MGVLDLPERVPAGHRRWPAPASRKPSSDETTTATHHKKARTPPVTPPEAAHREAGERRAWAGVGWKMRAAPDPRKPWASGTGSPRSVYHRQLGPPSEFPGPPHAPTCRSSEQLREKENLPMRCSLSPSCPTRGDSLPPEPTGVRPTSPLPSGPSPEPRLAFSRGHRSPSPHHSHPPGYCALLLGLGSKGTLASDPPQHHDSRADPHGHGSGRGSPGTQLWAGTGVHRPLPSTCNNRVGHAWRPSCWATGIV